MMLEVSVDYGWCLLVVVVMCFQIVIQGFSAGSLRRKLFTPDFFKAHFPELEKPPKLGYPDMGNGRFSAKLSFEDWMKFNSYQRSHYNYLEVLTPIVAFELIGGLFYPCVAAVLGIVWIVARSLYAWGYRSKGPKGRGIGAILGDVSLLGLFLISVYGSFQFAGGFPAIMAHLHLS
eukprot:TRINITY_DN8061_c0_g1_i2.p1 TRINITY_DN8061_c0_g1~~TRINITY_DN8061_c0_g1_i2.p1  ORF type:complete len:176 (-),score=17.94 TRINITY_DN8061_c0_g1_i2:73-600(-)